MRREATGNSPELTVQDVQTVQSPGSSPGSVQIVKDKYNSEGELPRFDNFQNVQTFNDSCRGEEEF